jgi:4-hydroxy-2-oxoheptanedioate aldolase
MQPVKPDILWTAAGQPRILHGVVIYSNAPALAELAGQLGFDVVWVDLEHGAADFARAEILCHAVEAGGAVPLLRVSGGERSNVLHALEVGARIVVVPMVNTAQQAREIVRHGKFPPLGERGFNLRSRGVGYGLLGVNSTFERANASTHLLMQIETVQAVENLDGMLAVEGISGIFIGPGDLSVSVGVPGRLDDPAVIDAAVRCIGRARERGMHAGILCPPCRLLDAALAAGCDLCICGGDIPDLVAAWRERLAGLAPAGEET